MGSIALKPLRRVVVALARRMGYEVWRMPDRADNRWSDADFYRPHFSPWLGFGQFARYRDVASPYTLVTADRLYVLGVLLNNALEVEGEVWECGVYRGGTARLFARILADRDDRRPLRLFDTFAGLPAVDSTRDLLKPGEFGDTDLRATRATVGAEASVTFHRGTIPQTFEGLETNRIAFAHIDVDLYRSVTDCCAFIYPRLVPGGAMIFDDYGMQTTPGARAAVDGFFADKPETPLVLASGQAFVMRVATPTG